MSTQIQNLVSVQDTQEAGAIVWWRLAGATPIAAVEAAWADASLTCGLPVQSGPATIFRRVVTQQATKRRMVRPLKGASTFAIVDETVGEEAAEYAVHGRVAMTMVDDAPRLTYTDIPAAMAAEIGAQFEAALQAYDADDISFWLSNALVTECRAVPLRDRGGVYFVPRDHLPLFRLATAVLSSVSGHVIYEVPAMTSRQAVQAIMDAVSREAEAFAAETEHVMLETDLGGRALKTRSIKLEGVVAKVGAYEALLGAGLDTLRDRLDTLKGQLAAAYLMATTDEVV